MKRTITILFLLFLLGSAAYGNAYVPDRRTLADPKAVKGNGSSFVNSWSASRKSQAMRADAQTISYGYCGEPQMAFGTEWQEYTALVEFPEVFTEMFDGGEIIGVQIASPDNFEDPTINNFTSLTIGFHNEKGGDPFYSQPATLSTVASEWNDIMLDTPLKIEAGKPFYVGYSGKAPTIDDSCFAVDYQANDKDLGLWLGWEDEYTGEYVWESYTGWYGNLCLRLLIKADKLPTDQINLDHVYLPGYVNTGKPFEMTVAVTNTAYNEINNFTFQYSLGGETRNIVVEATPSIPPQQEADVTVKDLICDKTGPEVPLVYAITAVNGNSDAIITDSSDHDTHILSLPEGVGYSRNVVVEEGTGTWCGYCPLGIVGMKYMSEKYTDGSFIPIAVHYSDKMETPSYMDFANEYFNTYPSAVANRDTYRFGILEPDAEILEIVYRYLRDIPAYAEIDLAANISDDSDKVLTVTTTSRFAIPTENKYRIEITLTENKVGPYPQTNFFAGNAEGPMGGFEDMPDPVDLMFNDVARGLYKAAEHSGVSVGIDYEDSISISLDDLSDDADISVIAMLINETGNEIENASFIHLGPISGVETIGSQELDIESGKGFISVSGSGETANVYSLDGTNVATIKGSGTARLNPGIYIVTAADKSYKVIVK